MTQALATRLPDIRRHDVPVLPNIRRPALAGLGVVALLVGGLGTWAATAPLSSAALAPGAVAVESKRKTVQHLEGGIVERILVREGERVAAGQPLIRLDTTQAESSWNVATGQLRAERALEARLIAERDGTPHITFPADLEQLAASDPGVREILDAQRRIFAARHAALKGQREILTEQTAQLRTQIDGLRAQERATIDQRRLIADELAAVSSLVEKGLELMPRLRELQRTAADLDGRLGQLRSEIAKSHQAIGETRLQIIDLDNQRAEEVVSELRDVQRNAADLHEEVRAAEDVLRRRDVLAPVDGSIVTLSAVTPGGVAEPGATLMEIVPEDDKLTIDARAQPNDIDSLHAGLPAEVRLTAFKAWNTPTLRGEVTYVSADSLVDEATNEPYYDLRIEVGREELERLPDSELYPGMPVQTIVVTGERPLLEYLVQPVLDSLARAFREE